MKRLCKFILLLFVVLLTACHSRTTNVLSLEYFQDSTSQIVEVYKHDHKFDGEAWNKEENFSVSALRGILTNVTMYYGSGDIAIKDSDSREYYDKDGTIISQGKFKALYPFMEAQFDSLKAQYISIVKYGSTTPY